MENDGTPGGKGDAKGGNIVGDSAAAADQKDKSGVSFGNTRGSLTPEKNALAALMAHHHKENDIPSLKSAASGLAKESKKGTSVHQRWH